MNKMDLIRQNMNQRKERTLDALSDNLIRSRSASIPLKEIRLNPKNVAASDDGDEDIQRLADDIATVGLLHNLVVNQTGENDYMLISGERRYKALTKLGWTHAPCVVYDHLPEAMFGVMTVLANIDAREYSAAKRLMLYQELDTKLRELKKLGIYRGGIGRGIAQMMGVSEQQIGKYKKLTAELSTDELANVTNISTAFKELNNRKTETGFQFFSGVDRETRSSDSENLIKTETEFQFFEGDDRETQSSDLENLTKTETQFQFSASDVPQGTSARTPMPESDPVQQPKSYPITAQEVNINYDGINYLCAFGTHVNGGWIAILNFGVATELSTADAAYNTEKIEAALRRSDDPLLLNGNRLTNAAKQIAMIVTERIGEM